MDFSFTDEQNMLRDTLSRLVRDHYDFDTRSSAIANRNGFRREFWDELCDLGLLGLPFIETDGGFGGSSVDMMIVMEELGKGLVVEPYVPTIVCAGGFLKHAGSESQKEDHLAAIIDGSRIFAFAHGEQHSRYNLADVDTSAEKKDESYVINGHKSVVIGAPSASHLIVTARTAGDRRNERGISVFVLPKDKKGITVHDYPTVDGRRASEIYFENVSIPVDSLIGKEGAAYPLIEQVADEAVTALCAEITGAMQVAHRMTLDYARERKQFGVPIADFQALQHRMVDMYTEYELAVSMVQLAARASISDESDRKRLASSAKIRVGQAAHLIGKEAVQIHGGMGMTDELPIGHYFKRLAVFDNEFGDVDFHMRRYVRLSEEQYKKAKAA